MNSPQYYEGYYFASFEVNSFMPKGANESWWLSGDVPCSKAYQGPTRDPKYRPPLYLKVRGSLSPEGHYGHLNGYRRELNVQQVVACRLATQEEQSQF